MSEEFKITALGREEFVTPYSLCGFAAEEISEFSEAVKFISEADLKSSVFLLDEDLIQDEEKIAELESEGANILILKGWGSSDMAERKIKTAAIKAIGTDIDINKE